MILFFLFLMLASSSYIWFGIALDIVARLVREFTIER